MQQRVFDHLAADKATLYRAVLDCFGRAKEHFVLHLRPGDVLEDIADSTLRPEDLEPLFQQLVKWGNLASFADTSEVKTVEDFYQKRSIYQLTRAGEAAEHAIQQFWEELRRSGELKTAALGDIHDLLQELLHLTQPEPLDEGKVHRTLSALRTRFQELTREAQVFLGGLQRAVELHGVGVERFIEYKERLLEYLNHFIGELVRSTVRIAEVIVEIEKRGIERVLEAATLRDLVDTLIVTDDDQREVRLEWRQRWLGIRSWFMAGAGERSQSELLRARARSAIPALLSALSVIHDRRHARSDRAADLVCLARWFAEVDSEADAHRLWRVAFGLGSSRHLKVDAASLEAREASPVPASTSWLAAPPVEIAPRLRKTGRWSRTGRPGAVIDRARERRKLALLSREETRQVRDAQRVLARDDRLRLSDMGHLNRAEFALFRDLLGRALARKLRHDDTIETSSSDGTLQIRLEPILDAGVVTLSTDDGLFRGNDHWISITHATGAGAT